MHIAVDDDEIELQHFIVCKFYGVETCFCWDENKVVVFPYTGGNSLARDARVLSMPDPLRKIWLFDGRAFFICSPQGAYKLSRAGEFVLLSKNALDMGSEYFEVLTATSNGVHLDNKQVKSSTSLFPLAPNASEEEVRAFSLILEDTERRFINCFIRSNRKKNVCVIAYDRRLFTLMEDNTVQLIYTSDRTIVDIVPIKRGDKVAGLLLLISTDMIILVHGRDELVFERIYLRKKMRNISTFCAYFSMEIENVLWMIYCDQSKMYYMRKELFDDTIQEIRVEEKTFRCIQYYKPNIILGLSQEKELIELSLEALENSLLLNNDVNLHIDMFQKTDLIMEKICAKVKELDMLYENMMDERDNLRRINLYVSKQKLQLTPHMEVSRLCNYYYLDLNISGKLPRNSHIVFAINFKNQSMFCMKKITEMEGFILKMPINGSKILRCSNINIDLITWMNRQEPWCLMQNFIYSPPQDIKRKRGAKKNKTAFIDAKIASLQKLIAEKDLNIAKLSEIKRIIRAEL
ncbi:uncharacterized protein [Anoplolepis gracilipes]|uniref:uncharacterized protein n=1 Tax=Anoplolepis gracilipes TaxID=354296 RepID=UPI003BA17575